MYTFAARARLMIANLEAGELKKICALLLTVLTAVASFAAGSPKLALSWKNPNYTGETFQNILVLAINGKAANRAEFEDELEEVPEPIFVPSTAIKVPLELPEVKAVEQMAQAKCRDSR